MALQSSNSLHLTDFALFGKLPPEVQCIIWKKALPGPRILELEYVHGNAIEAGDGPVMQGHFTSEDSTVNLLQTCVNSRNTVLLNYVAFPTMVPGSCVYFDPALDTIVIARHGREYRAEGLEWAQVDIFPGSGILQNVENICFTAENLSIGICVFHLHHLLDGYPKVKTITIAASGVQPSLGRPVLKEAERGDPEFSEFDLCNGEIRRFHSNFTARYSGRRFQHQHRMLPTVKLMTLTRVWD